MKAKNIATLVIIMLGISGRPSLGAPVRKVLMEELTATWCAWCTDGSHALDSMRKDSDRNIVVSYHTFNDNMTSAMSQDFMEAFGNAVSGFPTIFMDRGQYGGKMDIDPRFPKVFNPVYTKLMATPAQVGIAFRKLGWDAASRTITGEIAATFVANGSGDFRIGLIVIEDQVTGGSGRPTMMAGVVKDDTDETNSAYDQASISEIADLYPDLEYKDGKIIKYPHMNVARAAVFDVHGKAGVIPPEHAASTAYALPFTYKVPERYDPTRLGLPVNLKNIGLVAFVANYGDRNSSQSLLNSEQAMLADFMNGTSLSRSSGGREASGAAFAQRVAGKTYVMVRAPVAGAYAVSLFDARGRLIGVMHSDLEAGANRIPVPAESQGRLLFARLARN